MKKAILLLALFLGVYQVSIASTPPAVDGAYTSHVTYQFD